MTSRGTGEPTPTVTLRDGTAATLHRYVLRLRRPLAIGGRGALGHRRGVLVCLRGSDGRAGWGDAAPLEGWGGPDPATTMATLEGWLRAAADVDDPETLARRAAEGLSAVPCAWAAIGGAVADLVARRRDETLTSFLRAATPTTPGAPPTEVPTAALLDGESPAAVAAAAAVAAGEGFGTLKLKVGSRPLAEDLRRVAALREAAPDAGLRLDANGAWGRESLTAAEALAGYEPEFIEEPCHGLEHLRQLQARTPVPIAADESLPPLAALHRHLPLGVSVAVLKPSALGDPHAVLRATADLVATGTAAVVGSFLESAVGVATAAGVAAAAGGPPAGLGTSTMLLDDVCEPLPVEAGAVQLPAGRGLGITPDRSHLTKLRDPDT